MSVKKKKKSRCSDEAEDLDPPYSSYGALRIVDSNSKTSIIVIDNDKKKERKKKKNALELCQESCAGQYSGMN